MPTPTWRGSDSIHEAPGSPHRRRNATEDKIIRTLRGPYGDLIAAEPDPGETMTGYTGYVVESVETFPDGAGVDGPGHTRIVLTIETPPVLTSTVAEVIEEIEAGGLEKKLESHPIYQPGGSKELEPSDLDAIAEWRAAPTAAARAAIYGAMTDNAKHFTAKLQRGVESYIVAAPVTRITTRSYNKPTVGGIGVRLAAKPFDAAPNGYVWLKTADRAQRQGPAGKWERVQECTGADVWDTDLYPAAP